MNGRYYLVVPCRLDTIKQASILVAVPLVGLTQLQPGGNSLYQCIVSQTDGIVANLFRLLDSHRSHVDKNFKNFSNARRFLTKLCSNVLETKLNKTTEFHSEPLRIVEFL